MGCMVYRDLHHTHLLEVGLTQIPGDQDFFNNFLSKTNFGTDCRVDSITNSKTDKHHQYKSLKLIEFEIYCIKPNPPLFFPANTICNGPATWSILTSHYA